MLSSSLSPISLSRFFAVEHSHDRHTDLTPDPINASGIIAGDPIARSKLLHLTPDKHYSVALWDCTAGTFRWHYYYDEVVHILEGEVTVHEDNGNVLTLQAGDIALFPRGASNVWTVPHYVRKVAINRFHKPTLLELPKKIVARVFRELKQLFSSGNTQT